MEKNFDRSEGLKSRAACFLISQPKYKGVIVAKSVDSKKKGVWRVGTGAGSEMYPAICVQVGDDNLRKKPPNNLGRLVLMPVSQGWRCLYIFSTTKMAFQILFVLGKKCFEIPGSIRKLFYQCLIATRSIAVEFVHPVFTQP